MLSCDYRQYLTENFKLQLSVVSDRLLPWKELSFVIAQTDAKDKKQSLF